jgi:ketol-acid reductoisomerase
MAHIYRATETEIEFIRTQRIAVIGYGSQGRSQARNLRDSGLDVRVGLYEASRSWPVAEADGMPVFRTHEAVQDADVVMMATPDGPMAAIYKEDVSPVLRPGTALAFSHGFNVHFGLIEAPEGVDVILISPKGAGPGVRRLYEEGSGVPGLLAIEKDFTGKAVARCIGYAWGIGCGRAAMFGTTFKEETETDLFGEQAVLCGGIPELVKMGFETLVEAGYQPEAAFFECMHETKLVVDLLYARGLTGLREKISDTAEWGGYESGPRVVGEPARAAMRAILTEIQDGSFARKWVLESGDGSPNLKARRRAESDLLVEQVGAEVRSMIPELNG